MSPVIVSAPEVPPPDVRQYHQFTLAGLPLTGWDDLGALWTVEKVKGWFTGSDTRSATIARTAQSGSWRGTTYRDGRVVTLQGKVRCPSTLVLEQVSRRLASLLAGGEFGQLAGESPFGLLTAQVQMEDTPLFDPLSDVAAAWQVTVGSESPLLFGHDVTNSTTLTTTGGGAGLVYPLAYPLDYGATGGITPGSLFATNDGTADYWPRLKITGPVVNPVITVNETGDSFRFNGTVEDGQTLDILCADRRVVLNGYASRRFLAEIQGSWLAIPPGGATLSVAADSTGPGAKFEIFYFEGAWS